MGYWEVPRTQRSLVQKSLSHALPILKAHPRLGDSVAIASPKSDPRFPVSNIHFYGDPLSPPAGCEPFVLYTYFCGAIILTPGTITFWNTSDCVHDSGPTFEPYIFAGLFTASSIFSSHAVCTGVGVACSLLMESRTGLQTSHTLIPFGTPACERTILPLSASHTGVVCITDDLRSGD